MKIVSKFLQNFVLVLTKRLNKNETSFYKTIFNARALIFNLFSSD